MTYDNLIEQIYNATKEWLPCHLPHPDKYVEYYEKIFAVNVASAGSFYGRSLCVGELYIANWDGGHSANLTFRSIDDGCVPILGPTESLEKAKSRLDLIKSTFNMAYVPNIEELNMLAQKTGTFVNI